MSPVERDASELDCTYHKICNFYVKDECFPNEYFWSNCWVFRIFKGLLKEDVEIAEYESKTLRDVIEGNNEN